MINTDPLTKEQIDELNESLRSANVTEEDVKQIAQELRLGEATVKRWFDATNSGDYSPAIPLAAVGKEDYLLQDNGEPEYDEYGQAIDAYQNDPYLDETEPDGDESEDVNSDDGITDPAEDSLHNRLLIAALLTDAGYSREPMSGVTYTGTQKTANTPIFGSLYALTEFVENVIGGKVDYFNTKAWIKFNAYSLGNGTWQLDYVYASRAKGEGS